MLFLLLLLLLLATTTAQAQVIHLSPLAFPSSGVSPAQATLTLNSNVANAAVNSLDPCRYFENVTDVQQLNHHEVVTFEQCLYYFLASRAQQQASGIFGALHPIATLPPAYSARGKGGGGGSGQQQKEIKVRIGQITLQHFQLNEFLKDLHIVGYMQMEWDDGRLAWDQSQWHVDKLTIHSASHIWMPVLSSQAYDTSLKNDDAMEVRKIETSSKGNVSSIISFGLKTFCDDADFRHFPDDTYKCCYVLEPHFNQELIALAVDGMPIFTEPKYFRDYGWSISATVPTVNPDPNVIAQLSFCINLQRSSSAVKIELWVPTWATVLLFLFSPLFGSIKLQIYVKLFLLLLQFMALQLFSNRIAPHLGSAAATPIIMSIHELAMVLNVVSIVFSLVICMLMRLKYTLPPWGWLSRLSQITNKLVFPFHSVVAIPTAACSFSPHEFDDSLSLEKGGQPMGANYSNGVATIHHTPATSSSTNHGAGTATTQTSTPSTTSSTIGRYQSDWLQAFLAIHALGTTFFSVVFILGYLLIR